jgi:hypothetical protein
MAVCIVRAIRSTVVYLGLALALLVPRAAAQDTTTTYMFVGSDFNNCAPNVNCPKGGHLTGSFTLATPLPANYVSPNGIGGPGDFFPEAFCFTDGTTTIAGQNSGRFSADTDGNGNLSQWSIRVDDAVGDEAGAFFGPHNVGTTSSSGIQAINYGDFFNSSVSSNPATPGGVWTTVKGNVSSCCPQMTGKPMATGPSSYSGLPTEMFAEFSPNDNSTLTKAAAACGYDKFDFQQVIRYWPPESPLTALQPSAACPGPLNFCLAPFFDPPPVGYTYFLKDPPLYAPLFNAYPFYYAPSALLFGCAVQDQSGDCVYEITSLDDKTLRFFDAPIDNLLLPFDKGMQFTTSLVGIDKDKTIKRVLKEWSWTSTYNQFFDIGGIPIQSASAQTVDGNGTGGITITDINGVQQTPPTTTCTASASTLWPPNGMSVVVTVSGSITAGTSSLVASTYKVIDSYGLVHPTGNINLTGGAYSFGVPLIAARNGNDLNGRTYTIVVMGSDSIGNVGACSAVITVPHDQGN